MGRDGVKKIETPERLWELFEEYMKWAKANPIKKMVFVGKDGSKDEQELERPLTTDGFEAWLILQGIIGSHLGHYASDKKESYKEYVPVMNRIRQVVRADQIDGGSVGIYQHNIIARLQGLTEKTDNKNENTNINITAEFGSQAIHTPPESEGNP